jgi:DNA polymerase-3 subunit epsilon
MLREIVFDTETTGLNPLGGDRVVEIGCIELIDYVPTGENFHVYLNPERDMPDAAFRVHGLSNEFLRDKPRFVDIADDFERFIGDAKLIAHNASFDLGFLNAELSRIGREEIISTRIIDTLVIARRKFPFGPNNLDALCQRLQIDNSRRTKHGALLDAEILAEVYIELLGGRQKDLGLSVETQVIAHTTTSARTSLDARPRPLPQRLSPDDLDRHAEFISGFGSAILWNDYIRQKTDS